MRKLVYENKKAIESKELFANQLVDSLNLVLNRFKDKYNYFSQPIDEATAFDLVSEPLKFFDNLLLTNSPIKKIGNIQQNPEKLAEMLNVDRVGFIAAFTIELPGSRDSFNRSGVTSFFKLQPSQKHLVSWQDGTFIVDEKALEENRELSRIYADTPKQIEEVKQWETLKDSLNNHLDKGFVDIIQVRTVAKCLGFEYGKVNRFEDKEEFIIDYKRLGEIVQRNK